MASFLAKVNFFRIWPKTMFFFPAAVMTFTIRVNVILRLVLCVCVIMQRSQAEHCKAEEEERDD